MSRNGFGPSLLASESLKLYKLQIEALLCQINITNKTITYFTFYIWNDNNTWINVVLHRIIRIYTTYMYTNLQKQQQLWMSTRFLTLWKKNQFSISYSKTWTTTGYTAVVGREERLLPSTNRLWEKCNVLFATTIVEWDPRGRHLQNNSCVAIEEFNGPTIRFAK